MAKKNDPFNWLKSSGIPLAIWATMLVYGTMFYSSNTQFQKETIKFQDESKQRFDDFSKYREKQAERDGSLLLEVKTMGNNLNMMVKALDEMRVEQKEIRGDQSKINDTIRSLKGVR